jgi:hypothetical protein
VVVRSPARRPGPVGLHGFGRGTRCPRALPRRPLRSKPSLDTSRYGFPSRGPATASGLVASLGAYGPRSTPSSTRHQGGLTKMTDNTVTIAGNVDCTSGDLVSGSEDRRSFRGWPGNARFWLVTCALSLGRDRSARAGPGRARSPGPEGRGPLHGGHASSAGGQPPGRSRGALRAPVSTWGHIRSRQPTGLVVVTGTRYGRSMTLIRRSRERTIWLATQAAATKRRHMSSPYMGRELL